MGNLSLSSQIVTPFEFMLLVSADKSVFSFIKVLSKIDQLVFVDCLVDMLNVHNFEREHLMLGGIRLGGWLFVMETISQQLCYRYRIFISKTHNGKVDLFYLTTIGSDKNKMDILINDECMEMVNVVGWYPSVPMIERLDLLVY